MCLARESQSKRLQKLQNRAARIILNMSNDVNHSIALRAKAKIMYKVLNKMGPKSLTNIFHTNVRKLQTIQPSRHFKRY